MTISFKMSDTNIVQQQPTFILQVTKSTVSLLNHSGYSYMNSKCGLVDKILVQLDRVLHYGVSLTSQIHFHKECMIMQAVYVR